MEMRAISLQGVRLRVRQNIMPPALKTVSKHIRLDAKGNTKNKYSNQKTANSNLSYLTKYTPTQPHPCMDKGLPGFVSKLYRMVNDPTLESLICWNAQGDAFHILNPEQFSREVLPRYCKHNNFSSFVRQLNMYGFHKVPHLQEDSVWEFKHLHFLKDHPDLLPQIRRKTGRSEDPDSTAPTPPSSTADSPVGSACSVSSTQPPASLNTDISTIKMQQETIYAALKDMQAENKHLWTETIATRQRFEQQQETINKILHFLASLFSGTGIGVGATVGNSANSPVGGAGAGSFLADTRSNSPHSPSSPKVGDSSLLIGRVPSGKRQMLLEGSAPGEASKDELLCEDIDLLKDSISMLSDDLIKNGWKDPELDSLFQSREHYGADEIEDVVDLFLNV